MENEPKRKICLVGFTSFAWRMTSLVRATEFEHQELNTELTPVSELSLLLLPENESGSRPRRCAGVKFHWPINIQGKIHIVRQKKQL